jgi:hypothetical protein
MVMQDDLKRIQRKVYMSYFQDGLWDILLGAFLLGWGLMLTYDFVAAIGGIWVGFYFIVLALKRWLIYPRAGYIRAAGEQRQKLRLLIMGVVLFMVGLAVFFLFGMGEPPAWLREYFMFLFGSMMAFVIGVLAYWWQVPRWYLYAVLLFIAFVAQQWTDFPLNLAFAVPGTIIALLGVALLVRFLKKYPRLDREDPGAAA